MKLIGAGFGRTGTESMKRALEHLGFAPCHHMTEVLPSRVQTAHWADIVSGRAPDWDRVFSGYRATVDWPSAHYWRELAGHFPEAKVLLTVRDPDAWYESFSKTILTRLNKRRDAIRKGDAAARTVGYELIFRKVFGGLANSRAHAIDTYQRNTEAVIAAMPPERLLVYELGSGWEPLCRFLEVPVPDIAYPRTNAAETFHTMVDGLMARQG